jgi:hypothetical protein
MGAERIQAYVRESVSDAPLRRVRAERAVREVLASGAAAGVDPTRINVRSLRTGPHLIAFACRHDPRNEVVVRVAWS